MSSLYVLHEVIDNQSLSTLSLFEMRKRSKECMAHFKTIIQFPKKFMWILKVFFGYSSLTRWSSKVEFIGLAFFVSIRPRTGEKITYKTVGDKSRECYCWLAQKLFLYETALKNKEVCNEKADFDWFEVRTKVYELTRKNVNLSVL